jgi:hypothetical protein
VDIDGKNVFISMSQESLWIIFEAYNVPDIDLLKSLYEYTSPTVPDRSQYGEWKITFIRE